MNIKNIGIDLVENIRFANKIDDQRFLTRIFSNRELQALALIENNIGKIQFIASRFACKEAFSKALGVYDGKTNFKDIEVCKDIHGRPYINFIKNTTITSFVSLSHTKDYSIAQVIITE